MKRADRLRTGLVLRPVLDLVEVETEQGPSLVGAVGKKKAAAERCHPKIRCVTKKKKPIGYSKIGKLKLI